MVWQYLLAFERETHSKFLPQNLFKWSPLFKHLWILGRKYEFKNRGKGSPGWLNELLGIAQWPSGDFLLKIKFFHELCLPITHRLTIKLVRKGSRWKWTKKTQSSASTVNVVCSTISFYFPCLRFIIVINRNDMSPSLGYVYLGYILRDWFSICKGTTLLWFS